MKNRICHGFVLLAAVVRFVFLGAIVTSLVHMSYSMPPTFRALQEAQNDHDYISAPHPTTTTTTTTTNLTTTKKNATTATSKSTITSSSSSSFVLEDELDLTKPGNCGREKCFFPSSKNNATGYLVGSGSRNQLYQNMKSSWKDVQRFGGDVDGNNNNNKTATFRHFLAGPPMIVMISNETLTRLNWLSYWEESRKDLEDRSHKNYYGNHTAATTSSSTTRVFVQKVYIAPSPSLTLFCHPDQQHLTIEKLSKFSNAVTNKTFFQQTFDREWEMLQRILNDDERLWIDFQIMVDITGRIYHIDLDRYQEYTRKQTKKRKFQRWVVLAIKSKCRPFVKNVTSSIIS